MLPRGGTLPQEEWEQRHRALQVFLWLNAIGLSIGSLVSGDASPLHAAAHGAALVVFALVAARSRFSRTIRSISVSLGLLTAASVLVHITHGLIEAHFYFFVMIVVLTLYEDWRPFLIAVGYVLLHHGGLGMLQPHEVFNRPEEWQAPWKWAAIHALFVAGAGVAAVIAWRLNENIRERMLAAQAMLEDAAMVDSLTDLPNRRQLMADLTRLSSADAAEPTLLAMFDLDGFKNYNDTFGHAAGDALLTRLGRRLADVPAPPARAYRLGGDEFCLLAPVTDVDVPALLDRAEAALSEHGEGFEIGCSYGSALLPHETVDPEEALQLADQRMYQQKSGGRPSAGRQAGDVLLRTLEARHPDLGEHLGGVAALSAAVARELGLGDDDVETIRQAAELHDVGKVAIPDEILLKPGALTDEERTFMQSHTVIGERIVGAAPALFHVARIVRSTHERFDGRGYPDGLAGHDIPLSARVIFVCDAFDAMVTPRPYRRHPKSHDAALAELHRCAGTQFDPRVVQAFTAVVAERSQTVEPTPGPSGAATELG